MKLNIYQIDAFTDQVFSGNPAAVCILENWLDNETMQRIAAENNLAETAFLVKKGDGYEIRWFTPSIEVALCGHATLASAFVLFNYYGVTTPKIIFYSQNRGALSVEKGKNGLLILDFPVDPIVEIQPLDTLNEAIGKAPVQAFKGKTDYLLIYETQQDIEDIEPNFYLLGKANVRGVIVSAKGQKVDFVSRFFAPGSGIDEDPVTGSAHTTLTPYWSKQLGKTKLSAKQLSKRGGDLFCEDLGERIKISGKAVPYLIGEIEI
ncbi:PhzF family phenazine biosynthesis protein [Ulvibacterium marinum]|uniref:PhzF family phenazine biosynthesis protein n=1 Tax=Ulvibacterium marinum TaxID=2419782 RepID=A0A3B0C8V1_9FLAO|nr:PhzF family phenazine biosynthesis protein [Ulvibacterium marinum]RKN82655.1 PhzF family phenazine biosynthesis protein [Ulvibacterium marinum]